MKRSNTITSLRWAIPLSVESISERKHYGWKRNNKNLSNYQFTQKTLRHVLTVEVMTERIAATLNVATSELTVLQSMQK